jgi:hypothetical protein
MMMKGMKRVALSMVLAAAAAAPLSAAPTVEPGVENDTEIYVVNNHLVDVRVYVEDAEGKLHNIGRVPRGALRNIQVPAECVGSDYRIKIFPTSPVWSSVPDDYGVKTNPLNNERDHQVTVWLEADLTQSLVEIDRG